MRQKLLAYSFLGTVAAVFAFAVAACAPEDEPFPFDYHGTPTPTPVPVANATPEKIITQKYDIISKGETIKIAEWDDNSLKMLNFLAGYVIIFGFDHAVELVDLGDRHYGDALLAGDVHLVLWMDEEWYKTTGADAGILNIGTLYQSESDLRIGASPALQDASRDIIEFLGSFVPGDDTVESLASRITGGRIGMRPNVVGVKYFKENGEIWTQWIDAEAGDAVQTAIDEGKTGLINRKCIPDGGNDNCVN
ncbi:MAG: hypothetical protein OXD46_05960 [Chloroflexi bacterium]|nr:hypothetical protein [Chloroflexota bacterium]